MEKILIFYVYNIIPYIDKMVFYRCLLASLLPDSVKKALYLDSDILVLKPLDDFWNTNLILCADLMWWQG